MNGPDGKPMHAELTLRRNNSDAWSRESCNGKAKCEECRRLSRPPLHIRWERRQSGRESDQARCLAGVGLKTQVLALFPA